MDAVSEKAKYFMTKEGQKLGWKQEKEGSDNRRSERADQSMS